MRHEHSRELERRILVILRHKAPLHGLTVRHDGYVDVEALCRLRLEYTRAHWEPPRNLDLEYLQALSSRRPDQVELLHEQPYLNVTDSTWYIRAKDGHTIANVNVDLEEVLDPAFVPLAVHITTRTKWKRIMNRGAIKRKKDTVYIHFHAQMKLGKEEGGAGAMLILDVTTAMLAGLKFYRRASGEIVTQGDRDGVVPLRFLSLHPQPVADGANASPSSQRVQEHPRRDKRQNRVLKQISSLEVEKWRLLKAFTDNNDRLTTILERGESLGGAPETQTQGLHAPEADDDDDDDVIIISSTPKPPDKWIIVPVGIPGCGKTGMSAAIAHIFSGAHVQIGDMDGPRASKDFLSKVADVLHTDTVVIADRNNHRLAHRQALRDIAAEHMHKTGVVVKVIMLQWQLNIPSARAVHATCYQRIMSWRAGQQWFVATPGESLESVLWKFLYEADPLQPHELEQVVDVDVMEVLEDNLDHVVPELARLLHRQVPAARMKNAIDVAQSYHPKTRRQVPKSEAPPKGREMPKPSKHGAGDAELNAAQGDPPLADNGAAQQPSGTRIPRPRKGPVMDLRAARTLSKRLAAVLRHRAEEAGLKMRGDGYARMDDLLALPTFRKQTFEAIRTVVEMSDVQRFTLVQETDAATGKTSWWIRANQGHTMESVTVEMEELRDASLVPMAVHATTRKAWKSIWTYGISRMARQHIHLHPGLEKPGMRRNDPILIFVDVRKAMDAGIKFLVSSNNVVLTAGDADGFLRPEFFLRVERSGRPIAGFDGPRTAAT